MSTVAPSALPLSKRSAVIHTVLGLFALAALYASQLPALAAYSRLISAACGLLGLGTVAAARAYLPTAVQAILKDLTPSPAKGPTAGEIAAAKSSPVLFLPFLLVGFVMTGCAGWHAWTACELGQLPQTSQAVIPAAVQALEQGSEASALAALESIGSGLAAGQLSCVVEAIAADTEKAAVQRADAPTIIHNAKAFRAKHPERLHCDVR